MAAATERKQDVCPVCGCNKPRGGSCRSCRRTSVKVKPSDLKYWMEWAGVDVGCTPVKQWCRIHGVPDEILELAREIWQ